MTRRGLTGCLRGRSGWDTASSHLPPGEISRFCHFMAPMSRAKSVYLAQMSRFQNPGRLYPCGGTPTPRNTTATQATQDQTTPRKPKPLNREEIKQRRI